MAAAVAFTNNHTPPQVDLPNPSRDPRSLSPNTTGQRERRKTKEKRTAARDPQRALLLHLPAPGLDPNSAAVSSPSSIASPSAESDVVTFPGRRAFHCLRGGGGDLHPLASCPTLLFSGQALAGKRCGLPQFLHLAMLCGQLSTGHRWSAIMWPSSQRAHLGAAAVHRGPMWPHPQHRPQ